MNLEDDVEMMASSLFFLLYLLATETHITSKKKSKFVMAICFLGLG